jgi:succinate dehydrogenase (ubiquinone) membrane anchor subunit
LNKRQVGAFNIVAQGMLYAATGLTMFGLYKFNTNDVGITEFVGRVWNADKEMKNE